MNVQCPYCSAPVEIDITWARKNGRVFCCGCCKAFDVKVPEESAYNYPWREAPKKEVIPEPPKEEKQPEPVKEEAYDAEDFGVFWDGMDYGSGL